MPKIKKFHNFHKFILMMIIIKVILMGLFSSDYQNKLFMNFIEVFIQDLTALNGWNPYNRLLSEPSLFPYPPVMLLVESIGGGLVRIAATDSIFWNNVLFKLPTLLFDCLGCYWLTRMFPEKRKYIAVLYFASPVILYAAYMHGQLDLIPTVLFVGALYYLRQLDRSKKVLFPLMLALAVTSKLHILAALPIVFFYLAKREDAVTIIKLMGTTILFTAMIMLPFWNKGFLNGVIFTKEQTVLTKVFLPYVNVKLYMPVLAVGFVYLKAFSIAKMNRDLLYSFCGILFAVFLTMIPPMPGWYIWIVPFAAIFFIDIRQEKYKSLMIYAMLNFAYLLYFMFAHKTDLVDLYLLNMNLSVLKTDNEVVKNLLFTSLTCLLIYSIVLMYQMGIASNSLYKRRNQPFTFGISGDSGSGKSTLLSLISLLFGERNLLFIEGDGDHKWERGNAMWEHFTHLNPKANYIYRQAADIAMLRAGQSVRRVDYDHNTGIFTKKYKLMPKPYIVLCGLHSLYLPQIRKELDLKIYMDIDETLRRYWKIQRDVNKRSYTKKGILKQIDERLPDAEKYIYTQKKYADIVVSYFDETLTDCLTDKHQVQLSLKLVISASIDLEGLISEVERRGIEVQYDYDDDLKKQTVIFRGKKLEEHDLPMHEIAGRLIPQLDEIVRSNLIVEDNLHAILGLVILLHVSSILLGGDVR